jgi:hypothetical protein
MRACPSPAAAPNVNLFSGKVSLFPRRVKAPIPRGIVREEGVIVYGFYLMEMLRIRLDGDLS